MPTVLLMRCGRTAWDAEGRIRGALDIPLSPEGIAEIEPQAEQMKPLPIRAIFCGSDLPAVQTAEIVGRACRRTAKTMVEFREMRLGLWEGLLEREALHRNPKAYRLWRKDPLSVCPPLGESIEECYRRVSEALRRIAGKSGEKLFVLVCSPLIAAIVRCIAKDVPVHRLGGCAMPPAASELLKFR